MGAEQIAWLAERAAFRPSGRSWELHELHVPFDELTGSDGYERLAMKRLSDGTGLAVIGPSGAGKSSVIAWICDRLPASHYALRIPITAVEDPGSVGEVARLALSIALDELVLDAVGERDLLQARADSALAARIPSAVSAKLGGGAIPAEVAVNIASLREEFTQERLAGDHLLALNGRLVPILAEAGTTPVFVFEDTEATIGGVDERRRAEAFFAGPLSAFVEQVDAPTIVAVQTHLLEDSRAFGRLAPVLQRLVIPLLDESSGSAIEMILARRVELAGLELRLGELLERAALEQLADFYRQSSGDLRRVLVATHEACEQAAADGVDVIGAPHIRYGIAQWQ